MRSIEFYGWTTYFLGNYVRSLSEIPPINHTPFLLPACAAGGPRTVTIEELKERTKVTDSQLDTKIEETDMIILADHFDNIETYSTLFELTDSKKQDIIDEKMRYNTQAAMSLAMKLWKRRNPAAATYRALVEIVLSLRKVDVATKVCEFLVHKCECS